VSRYLRDNDAKEAYNAEESAPRKQARCKKTVGGPLFFGRVSVNSQCAEIATAFKYKMAGLRKISIEEYLRLSPEEQAPSDAERAEIAADAARTLMSRPQKTVKKENRPRCIQCNCLLRAGHYGSYCSVCLSE